MAQLPCLIPPSRLSPLREADVEERAATGGPAADSGTPPPAARSKGPGGGPLFPEGAADTRAVGGRLKAQVSPCLDIAESPEQETSPDYDDGGKYKIFSIGPSGFSAGPDRVCVMSTVLTVGGRQGALRNSAALAAESGGGGRLRFGFERIRHGRAPLKKAQGQADADGITKEACEHPPWRRCVAPASLPPPTAAAPPRRNAPAPGPPDRPPAPKARWRAGSRREQSSVAMLRLQSLSHIVALALHLSVTSLILFCS